jgi:hypothetical protein
LRFCRNWVFWPKTGCIFLLPSGTISLKTPRLGHLAHVFPRNDLRWQDVLFSFVFL